MTDAAKKTNGTTVDGREVVDGKVMENGRWVDGEVFDQNDYKVEATGNDKEALRVVVDGHKEIPENFRRAILTAIDGLQANGYKVEVKWKADGVSAELTFKATKIDVKPAVEGLTPLQQATLPHDKPEAGRVKDAPKTAEERDAKAKAASPVLYGSQTKANPGGTPAYPA